MDTKIFLQGFGSKQSVNTSEGLNMSLKGKRKLLPTNDMAEVISQYGQYMSEREVCNKIRLTCQVNPICSNVLFNRISEIVKDEGSSTVTFLNYGVSGDVHVFDNVEYKPQTMSFWSGGTMNYQSNNPLKNEKDTPLSELDEGDFNHLSNIASNYRHPTNAIRDMQLSRGEDHFVYHCGLDILNNHLIRSNTFKTICKISDDLSGDTIEEESGYTAFNTIADLMRNVEGKRVIEKLPFPITAGVDKNVKVIPMHLYQYDDIHTFNGCIEKRLISKYNGWVGFENKSKIKSYINFNTDEDMEMERPIMYMNGGDFVDMYPDRTLYSFVPKYNRFRDRIEKNWNYCITYPSSSTTEGFESIIQTNNNSLKAFYFDENTRADNGTKQLVIYSIAKHGLSSGDYVNIYNTVSGVTEKIIDNAEVLEIVDDYIFTVFNTDVQISREWVEISNEDYSGGTISVNGRIYEISQDHSYCSYIDPSNNTKKNYYIISNDSNSVNLDDDAQELSYKKVVNDIECDYYVRIFSKLPNFKYASADTSSEYEIYKNNGELIKTYQDRKYDFESHVSRLAFARNIYSDEIGELVFTDDIDISNLRDNLGRPLSSIYLTIVKNNKGYKEWYGFDNKQDWNENEISANTVEFSHCFGKVKCGIETSDESRFDDSIPSIYTISRDDRMPYPFNVDNINDAREYNNSAYTIDEHEVWFDTDKHYYGDLSYYDGYNAIERHIQPIMHRFNTAQRESLSSESAKYYRHLVYDEITNDDYDRNDRYIIRTRVIDNSNNKHEGYYYNPHYEIPIKTFDKVQTMMPDFLTMTSLVNTNNGARISVLENHYLSIGDKAILYDLDKNVYYTCITVKGDRDNYKMFTCNIYDENGNQVLINDLYPTYDVDIDSEEYDSSYDLSNFKLFKLDNLDIPSYARILKDGTCRLIWRNILNNGFNSNDDTVEEYPFTNGAFYVNRRIDLYVRRQDPYNFYGLYAEDDIEGNGLDITIEDNYVKEKDIVC